MSIELRRNDVREQSTVGTDHRRRGLITRGLDSQYVHRFYFPVMRTAKNELHQVTMDHPAATGTRAGPHNSGERLSAGHAGPSA